MSARSPKAVQFPTSLADIQFKALSIPAGKYRKASPSARAEVIDRIRCEFVEMRGFSPTVQQAARLFQINPDECGRLLTRLVQEGFLRQTPDGRFRLPS
jgi:hypothetical protein